MKTTVSNYTPVEAIMERNGYYILRYQTLLEAVTRQVNETETSTDYVVEIEDSVPMPFNSEAEALSAGQDKATILAYTSEDFPTWQEAETLLASTDYAVIKCQELGLNFATEYPELAVKRPRWRAIVSAHKDNQ